MPQRVPISPQWRMNFCWTGVSGDMTSIISVYSETTIMLGYVKQIPLLVSLKLKPNTDALSKMTNDEDRMTKECPNDQSCSGLFDIWALSNLSAISAVMDVGNLICGKQLKFGRIFGRQGIHGKLARFQFVQPRINQQNYTRQIQTFVDG